MRGRHSSQNGSHFILRHFVPLLTCAAPRADRRLSSELSFSPVGSETQTRALPRSPRHRVHTQQLVNFEVGSPLIHALRLGRTE
jgi:hypothetical protein